MDEDYETARWESSQASPGSQSIHGANFRAMSQKGGAKRRLGGREASQVRKRDYMLISERRDLLVMTRTNRRLLPLGIITGKRSNFARVEHGCANI